VVIAGFYDIIIPLLLLLLEVSEHSICKTKLARNKYLIDIFISGGTAYF
jgi:hypothetical protein